MRKENGQEGNRRDLRGVKQGGQPEKPPAVLKVKSVLFLSAVWLFAKLAGTGKALAAAFALPTARVAGMRAARPS